MVWKAYSVSWAFLRAASLNIRELPFFFFFGATHLNFQIIPYVLV